MTTSTTSPRLEPLVLAVTVFAVSLGVVSPNLVRQIAWPAFLLVMLTVGLPHGAVDDVVAAQIFGYRNTGRSRILCLAVYVALMGVVAALWWLSTSVGLILFLAVSAYHFGQGDLEHLEGQTRHLRWLYGARGLLVIGLLSCAQPDAANPVFLALAGGEVPAPWGPYIVAAALGQYLLLSACVLKRQLAAQEWVSAVSLTVMFMSVDLVWAFAVYFGVWHALRHMVVLVERCRSFPRLTNIYRQGAFFTVVPAAGLLAMAGFGPALWEETTGLPLVMGGLAVLTTPHILLVELLRSRAPKVRVFDVEAVLLSPSAEPKFTPGFVEVPRESVRSSA